MNAPMTVGTLEQRLRGMLGHLGRRDRQIVRDAIEAIHELATRLHAATAVPMMRQKDLSHGETPAASV